MAKDTGRLHVTVKSGGKRKLLAQRYVAQAKRDGNRSRAAYKLNRNRRPVSFP